MLSSFRRRDVPLRPGRLAEIATAAVAALSAVLTAHLVGTMSLGALPFADAGRLVVLSGLSFGPDSPEFEGLKKTGQFAAVAPYRAGTTLVSLAGSEHLDALVAETTPEFFDVLAVSLRKSTLTTRRDNVNRAVVSRRFSERASPLSSATPGVLRVGSNLYEVAGIWDGPTLPSLADVWLLPGRGAASVDRLDPARERTDANSLRRVIARLSDKASTESALAAATALQRNHEGRSPKSGESTVQVRSLDVALSSRSRDYTRNLILLGSLLAVSCFANTGLLGLVRTLARRHELWLRIALGATHRTLWREIWRAGLATSVVGTLVGGFGAWAIVRVLPNVLGPESYGFHTELSPLALLVAVACAFGAPAITVATLTVALALERLRPDHLGAGVLSPRQASFTRGVGSALVVAQGAMAVSIVVCAVLVLRSTVLVTGVPLGIREDTRTLIEIGLPGNDSPWPRLMRIREALSSEPKGGGKVELTSYLPMASPQGRTTWVVPDIEVANPFLQLCHCASVSGGLFAALGIELHTGRLLNEDDVSFARRVAVIDRASAERLWAGQYQGRRISVDGTPYEIVGAVERVVYTDPAEDLPYLQVYLPISAAPSQRVWLVPAIQDGTRWKSMDVSSKLRGIDASADVLSMESTSELSGRVRWPYVQRAWLLISIAWLAIIVNGTGAVALSLYVAHNNAQSVGVRLALGAAGRSILLEESVPLLRPAAFGVVAGCVVVGLAAGRLQPFLQGILITDPLSWCVAIAIELLVVSASVWLAYGRLIRRGPNALLRASTREI